MRFIDWLSVTQMHPKGGLPVVGNEMVIKYDLESGNVIRESPSMKTLEGSYSSNLSIRCDGFRVTVDGNPSRWQRLDNLFGLQTFDECIQVYNSILLQFGLPPFTKCTHIGWLQGPEDKRSKRISDGAIINRVDWTRNLSVGKGNAVPFLRALATQSIGKGKRPFLYPNGHTVDWGKGSTLWYQKVYNKAEDLKISQKKRSKSSNADTDIAYLESLINYCEEQGIIRDEREFKRAFLQRKNLCFYGMTREKDFLMYLNGIEEMIERLEMSTADYETIAEQLLERKIVTTWRAANTTQSYALAWLHGQPAHVSKSQYYVHRSRLLELGIDISIPYDVTKSIPQLKRQRVINVSTALPPSWYQMPRTEGFRLAS
ncbi:MAG: phage/plasmid replication protein, II/X family [Candidatus Sedimenticola sp. (ex Thyasira tokunagai)]